MFPPVLRSLQRGVIAILFMALLIVIAPPASANAIPSLHWDPVAVSRYTWSSVVSPTGSITTGCNGTSGYANLKTYDVAGQLIRELSASEVIDSRPNCITQPVVDRNDDLYGVPYGMAVGSSSSTYGPNLLAYDGENLKWKYSVGCSSTSRTAPVVGADGNIYIIANSNRLIGLTPEVSPGTTQPNKVLDIQVPTGCTSEIYAYERGIIVTRAYSTQLEYYSYTGQHLGQVPANAYMSDAAFNSSGKLFFETYGVPNSVTINMYDPLQGSVVWSVNGSTPGAKVQSAALHALPGGGVLAVIKEQKTVGGIPTTPTQYIYTLVVFNGAGIETARQSFQDSTISDLTAQVDASSNIALVWQTTEQTNSSSTPKVYLTNISVVDTTLTNVLYSETMSGNLNTANGAVYGYEYQRLYPAPHFVGPGVLYLAAEKCGKYCTSDPELYPIVINDLDMSYPRSDILAPRPSSAYIALGDSFSSGEGVEPFEANTALDDWNECHRSEHAYARLLVDEHGAPSLGSDGFRACSGAVTANITDTPQWDEEVQLGWWPDATTELVTLTIGGNDIGFAGFASTCVFSTCDTGSSAYNDAIGKINSELPGKLETTYQAILQYSPNADIYVIGYPQVVANKSVGDPDDSRCIYMKDGNTTWGDARAARNVVTQLNDTIEEAVNSVRSLDADNDRLHFVEMDGAASPFVGHEVCGTASTSWFQNIDQAPNDPTYVFHPNDLGQEGYATAVGASIG